MRRLAGTGFGCALTLVASCSREPPPLPPARPAQPPAAPRAPAAEDPLLAQVLARPAWYAEVEPESLRPDGQASTVPQIRDAGRLLETLPSGPSSDARGVLLCRVTVAHDRDWDSAGLFGRNVAPDVSAYVQIAGGLEVRARLPEDTYEGVLSVPAVSIPVGAELHLRLVDRDVAMDDPIGELRVPWPDTMPFVRSEGAVTVRCAVYPRELAGPLGEGALATASHLLDAAARERPTVDLLHDPLRSVGARTSEIRGAIRDGASFLGYADPAVVALLRRLRAMETGPGSAYRVALAQALERAPAPGTSVRVGRDARVIARDATCLADPSGEPRCDLSLELAYERIPEPPGFAYVAEVIVFPEPEAPHLCEREPEAGGAFQRTPGVLTHVFHCRFETLPPEAAPLLVRVNVGGDAVLLRAR